jgi:hypothetical protein
MSARFTVSLVLLLSLPVVLSPRCVGQQAAQQEPPATPPPVASPAPGPAGSEAKPADSADPDLSHLDLTPDAHGKLSQDQMQKLLRVVADKDLENDKLLRNYTFVERDVHTQLDGKGNVKSKEIKTYDVMEIYGEQVQRLTEKDDKPLDAKEAAKEDEKIQKIIDKRKNESDDARRKREEKEIKGREDERAFVRDVADAYNFTLIGSETLEGRDTWLIEGEPRQGFVPHAKDGKYLSDFRGRVWIDKADLQLAKMDVECLDTVSWGLFLARIHKGSRFMLEQTRVNDEVWLPLHLTFKVDLRLALVKGYHVDGEQTFRDYKKFRTSAKIVGVGEVKDEK